MPLFAYLEHLCLLEGLPTRKIHPVEGTGQCNLNIQTISCHILSSVCSSTAGMRKSGLYTHKCTHAYYKNYLPFCMYHTRFVSSMILQNFVGYFCVYEQCFHKLGYNYVCSNDYLGKFPGKSHNIASFYSDSCIMLTNCVNIPT